MSAGILTVCALTAAGDVVRVDDDASLARALREAKPGRTISIAPGSYRGGIYAKIAGTEGAPITIEGADPQSPPLIEGGDTGLQLSAARHVRLRNLRFRGAALNTINIDDGPASDGSAVGIVLEHLSIEAMSPPEDANVVTNGIKFAGVGDFIIRDCSISEWGRSSAIDLVGCRDGVIERCQMRNAPDASTGPQLKGGTQRVTIRGCTFDRAGRRAINAGGSTGKQYFRPRDASFEAKDLTIEDNLFIGSESAVAFVGIDGGVVRHNTIIEPGKWIFRILQESRDERFAPSGNVRIERNLIVYRAADVRNAVTVSAGTAPQTFRFVDNWWWCADAPAQRPQLVGTEVGSIHGIDPQLRPDDQGVPRAHHAPAQAYGVRVP